MIDFIKTHSLHIEAETVLNNELLIFPLSNVATTGEILKRAQKARFRGMDVSIHPTGEIKLSGSLHKYWEGGTNFNDYSLENIRKTINGLAEEIKFNPEKVQIRFIEIGVNIPLDYSPTDLIKTAVMYRNTPFQQMRVTGKGFGRVCENQRFDIKIYDKSLQYGLPYHLMRFEIKVKKVVFLKRYRIGTMTLADLTRNEYYAAFKTMLIDILNGILFFDPKINPEQIELKKDRELVLQGRYSEYWQNLTSSTRGRQRERFIELTNGEVIKGEIETRILEKWNELTTCNEIEQGQKLQQSNHLQDENEQTKTGQSNHLHNESEKVKTGQSNPYVIGYFVPRCPITGLSLTYQKKGTKYLTSSGIRWYQKNEPETYRARLETLLSEKWKSRNENSSFNVWVNEISHQIRNKFYNPKRRKSIVRDKKSEKRT